MCQVACVEQFAGGVLQRGFRSAERCPRICTEGWPWGGTKRFHISTVCTSTICLCLPIALYLCSHRVFFTSLLLCLLSSRQHAGKEQSGAPCSFSCPQFSFLFLFWLPSPAQFHLGGRRYLPFQTEACKLLSCYIKSEKMLFFFCF